MDDRHLHMLLAQKDFRDMPWLHLYTEQARLDKTIRKESIAPQTKVPVVAGSVLSHVESCVLITLHGTKPRFQN